MNSCVCGYTSSAHIARHKKKCKDYSFHLQILEKNQEIELLKRLSNCTDTALFEENRKLREKNEKLEQRIEELTSSLMREPKINQINILNIQPFSLTKLPDMKRVRNMLDTVTAADSVPKYIKLKHFNCTETQNIRIPNLRGNTIQVLEADETTGEKKWTNHNRHEMLDLLTDRNLRELHEEFGADKIRKWREWYKTIPLEGYDKNVEWRDLVRKVECLLMDQRNLKP